MAKVRDLLDWKRRKKKDPISFAEHLERAKERLRKPLPVKRAEVLTIDQILRLMGDTGPGSINRLEKC